MRALGGGYRADGTCHQLALAGRRAAAGCPLRQPEEPHEQRTAEPGRCRPAGNPRRKKALTALAAVVAVAGLGWGAYEWLVASHYESTDNAYVQGNVIQITPQIGGTVMAIYADDTDFVKAGQPLVQLDPADAKVALDQAEANLAQTVRQVRTLYANNGSLAAQVDLREADMAKAQSDVARANDDLNRRQSLVGNGAVSQEELNHAQTQLANARSALAAAQAGVAAAREQLASNQAMTEGTSVEQHPERAGGRRQGARGLAGHAARRAARAGRRLRRQAHGAAGPARGRRHAADVDHPAATRSGSTPTSRKASCARSASASR